MTAPSRPGTATDPVVAQPIGPDKSIDCIGFFCPIPILTLAAGARRADISKELRALSLTAMAAALSDQHQNADLTSPQLR